MNTKPERPFSLLRRAVRLWRGNRPMQVEWLRAVAVVRATTHGWKADAIKSKAGSHA